MSYGIGSGRFPQRYESTPAFELCFVFPFINRVSPEHPDSRQYDRPRCPPRPIRLRKPTCLCPRALAERRGREYCAESVLGGVLQRHAQVPRHAVRCLHTLPRGTRILMVVSGSRTQNCISPSRPFSAGSSSSCTTPFPSAMWKSNGTSSWGVPGRRAGGSG